MVTVLGMWAAGCGSAVSPYEAKKARPKPTLAPEAMEKFQQGQKLLREHKLPEALKEFQACVTLAPQVPQTHFWVGKVQFLQKDLDQAETSFKKGLELDPDNYQAQAMLGKIYLMDKEKSKLPQAQANLEKALLTSPDYADARFDLARVYAMKGETKKSFSELTLLFAQEPDFALYHYEMGQMLEAFGDKNLAGKHFQRAHQLNPKLAMAMEQMKHQGGEPGKKPDPAPEVKPEPSKANAEQKPAAR
jgi:tetratricopeptide (TPR) repeat protein